MRYSLGRPPVGGALTQQLLEQIKDVLPFNDQVMEGVGLDADVQRPLQRL